MTDLSEHSKFKLCNSDPERDFAFAMLPWRSQEVGLSASEWDCLITASFELLLLDADQFFCDYDQPMLTGIDIKSLGARLNSAPMRCLATHLSLQSFNRLALRMNLLGAEQPICSYANQVFDQVLFRNVADELWRIQGQFLNQWVDTGIFIRLFSLPYKTKLVLSEDKHAQWSRLLSDLENLAVILLKHLPTTGVFLLLNFWLRRVHEADFWLDDRWKTLKTLCHECWKYNDFENNRVHTYADYCGSVFAAQLMQQSIEELAFNVQGLSEIKYAHRGQRLPYVDECIYTRMGRCLAAAKDNPKGALLTRSCLNPASISTGELMTLIRFLGSFSSSHFMGNMGELIALPLVMRSMRGVFSDTVSCIPGSSIVIKKGRKQGPDGLLVTSTESDTGELFLNVLAVIEIKSYEVSTPALLRQLEQHRERLIFDGCQVIRGKRASHDDSCWSSASQVEKNRAQIIDATVKIDDNCLNITVIPASQRGKRFSLPQNVHQLAMPWTVEGFRAMGICFCLWILENFGRMEDPDDYGRGLNAWEELLSDFLYAKQGSKRDHAMARRLLLGVQGRDTDPDTHWFIQSNNVST